MARQTNLKNLLSCWQTHALHVLSQKGNDFKRQLLCFASQWWGSDFSGISFFDPRTSDAGTLVFPAAHNRSRLLPQGDCKFLQWDMVFRGFPSTRICDETHQLWAKIMVWRTIHILIESSEALRISSQEQAEVYLHLRRPNLDTTCQDAQEGDTGNA